MKKKEKWNRKFDLEVKKKKIMKIKSEKWLMKWKKKEDNQCLMNKRL